MRENDGLGTNEGETIPEGPEVVKQISEECSPSRTDVVQQFLKIKLGKEIFQTMAF